VAQDDVPFRTKTEVRILYRLHKREDIEICPNSIEKISRSGLIGKPPHLGCGHHVGSTPTSSTKRFGSLKNLPYLCETNGPFV